jgi:hypothetical protein
MYGGWRRYEIKACVQAEEGWPSFSCETEGSLDSLGEGGGDRRRRSVSVWNGCGGVGFSREAGLRFLDK